MGIEFNEYPQAHTGDENRFLVEMKLTCDGCGKSTSVRESVVVHVPAFGGRQDAIEQVKEAMDQLLKKTPEEWVCGSMTGTFRQVCQDKVPEVLYKDSRDPSVMRSGLFFGCCEEHLAAVMLRAVGIAKVAEKLLGERREESEGDRGEPPVSSL